MTSSEVTLNIDKVIKQAYRHNGLIANGQNLTSAQKTEGLELLSSLVDSFPGNHRSNFKSDWIYLEPEPSDFVKIDDNYYECVYPHTSSFDNRPGSGGQWRGFWKEITEDSAGANIVVDGSGFIIVDGDGNILSDDEPDEWESGESYNSISVIDLDDNIFCIGAGYYRDSSSYDREMFTNLTTDNYFGYGNKINSVGRPNSIYYRRRKLENDPINRVVLYPYPTSIDFNIGLEVYRFSDRITSDLTKQIDFLREAVRYWHLKLGVEVHLNYGALSDSKYNQLKENMLEAEQQLEGLNEECGDVSFHPYLYQ